MGLFLEKYKESLAEAFAQSAIYDPAECPHKMEDVVYAYKQAQGVMTAYTEITPLAPEDAYLPVKWDYQLTHAARGYAKGGTDIYVSRWRDVTSFNIEDMHINYPVLN